LIVEREDKSADFADFPPKWYARLPSIGHSSAIAEHLNIPKICGHLRHLRTNHCLSELWAQTGELGVLVDR
jgi:hypothetical protein